MSTDEQQGRRRSPVRDFFGGSPGGVILRLVILSIVVGFVLAWLGLSPMDLFRSLEVAMRETWENSGDLLRTLFAWFLAGAVIVIPIWLVLRLLRVGRGR